MGQPDRTVAVALDVHGVPVALRCRRGVVADAQSLPRECERRAAGGDKPYAHRVAGSDCRLGPMAGAAAAGIEAIPFRLLCLADLPDSGRAGSAELSGVVTKSRRAA